MKLPIEEAKLIEQFSRVMYSIPNSSEISFTNIFTWPMIRAKRPIENLIKNLKIPVHFYYGDNDWMEDLGA